MIENRRLYDINDEVMKYCRSLLWESKDSRAVMYLKESGLIDETIYQFDLGYSGEDGGGIITHLKSLGYSDDECKSVGICDDKGEIVDLFCDRVLFPVKNVEGKVEGFVGRALRKQSGCSIFTQTNSDSPIFNCRKSLYGIEHAQRSDADYYIVSEGCVDTLMINQAGFDMAINPLLTDFSYEEIDLDSNRSVLLAFDSDNFGKESCAKAQKAFLAAGYKVGIIDVSSYRDPAEFIRMAGVDAFAEKVRETKSLLT